jgi:HAD superfamily phosphoserine phosphatase-like hydrolase
MTNTQGLAIFDLDGTLLRGSTVCEVLASPLGRLDEMRRFETLTDHSEIAAARIQMARWYEAVPRGTLIGFLQSARWAPGAREGVRRLQEAGVEVAIASITWDFAVGWFARQLGIANFLGTKLKADGTIQHVWPEQKAEWLTKVGQQLQLPCERIAAVGDSAADMHMLRAATLSYFVGRDAPAESDFLFRPKADIRLLADEILSSWRIPLASAAPLEDSA